jgi:hypothetical protein
MNLLAEAERRHLHQSNLSRPHHRPALSMPLAIAADGRPLLPRHRFTSQHGGDGGASIPAIAGQFIARSAGVQLSAIGDLSPQTLRAVLGMGEGAVAGDARASRVLARQHLL